MQSSQRYRDQGQQVWVLAWWGLLCTSGLLFGWVCVVFLPSPTEQQLLGSVCAARSFLGVTRRSSTERLGISTVLV